MRYCRPAAPVRGLAAAVFALLVLAACAAGDEVAADPNAIATATPGPTPTATVFATSVPSAPASQSTTDGATSSDASGVAADEAIPTVATRGSVDTSTSGERFTGAEPISDPAELASLERVACNFETPPRTRPDCYELLVPENWADPGNGQRVALSVAVFPAQQAAVEADPIVYLEGGPGGNALSLLDITYESYFKPMTDQRQVIVFDQRGAGLSKPSLECPGFDALSTELTTVQRSTEEEDALALTTLATCREELVAQNIDLSQYNSSASATDLEAMRELLGHEQWNLLGVSYGSRLAQSAMRLYPDGIRSVVLDSIVPVTNDPTANFAPNGAAAFARLFANCNTSTECSAEYPGFEQRFFALVDEWNERPVSFDGLNPLTGDEFKFLFDGEDLFSLAYSALYSRTDFSALPELVAQAESGDFTLLSDMASVQQALADQFTLGMMVSVYCTEEVPFADPALVDELAPADLRYQRLARDFQGSLLFDVCEIWDVEATDPIENEPVESDIPTLLMGGRYDPITPAEGTSVLAETLSNSQTTIFAHEGHGLSTNECGASIVVSFFEDPDSPLNTSCVPGSPTPFWVSDLTGPITPVEYSGTEISGVRPEEWIGSDGNFFRSQSAADPAFLVAQNSFDLAASTILVALSESLGWDSLPTFSETRTVDDVDWSVFRGDFEQSSVIVAVSDAGADSIFLVVGGYPEDFPRFEDEVFEPALLATRPTR